MKTISNIPNTAFSVAFGAGIGNMSGGAMTRYQNVTTTSNLTITTSGNSGFVMSVGATVTISFLFDNDNNAATPPVARSFTGTIIRSDTANIVFAGTLNQTGQQVELNVSPGFNLTGRTDGYFRTDRDASFTRKLLCFAAQTRILTPSGPVAAHRLRPGDLVVTLDRGPRPLRWVGMRRLSAADLDDNPQLRPIRLRAGSLAPGVPVRDLLVSPQHRILLRSDLAQRLFGTPEVLVAARQLLALPGVEIAQDQPRVTYVHLLFDRHELVLSEGAATESFLPAPLSMAAVDADTQHEILALFPDLRDHGTFPDPVRPIVQGAPARDLAARHLRQGRALLA
ncbi:Hint domain-containing protein [Paracoccus sp. p4-l81]|uniref:Hint domain-containing protein n=1 Tax=Paracoccus sp. p4-l81 TaxID=3342806 RepID=UPI0035B8958A